MFLTLEDFFTMTDAIRYKPIEKFLFRDENLVLSFTSNSEFHLSMGSPLISCSSPPALMLVC